MSDDPAEDERAPGGNDHGGPAGQTERGTGAADGEYPLFDWLARRWALADGLARAGGVDSGRPGGESAHGPAAACGRWTPSSSRCRLWLPWGPPPTSTPAGGTMDPHGAPPSVHDPIWWRHLTGGLLIYNPFSRRSAFRPQAPFTAVEQSGAWAAPGPAPRWVNQERSQGTSPEATESSAPPEAAEKGAPPTPHETGVEGAPLPAPFGSPAAAPASTLPGATIVSPPGTATGGAADTPAGGPAEEKAPEGGIGALVWPAEADAPSVNLAQTLAPPPTPGAGVAAKGTRGPLPPGAPVVGGAGLSRAADTAAPPGPNAAVAARTGWPGRRRERRRRPAGAAAQVGAGLALAPGRAPGRCSRQRHAGGQRVRCRTRWQVPQPRQSRPVRRSCQQREVLGTRRRWPGRARCDQCIGERDAGGGASRIARAGDP